MNVKSLCVGLVITMMISGALSANPLRQSSGADGIVSVEAEHYDELIEASGGTFVLTGPKDGFTGIEGMEATGGGNANAGFADSNPRMLYQVEFVKTGTHYVWIRAWGATGSDDSCHAGLNGEESGTSDRMSGWNADYTWSNDTMDPEQSTIEVPSAGVHNLTVWQRENGLIIDKIVLTTNPDYTPTDDGPPESGRGAQATASGPNPGDGDTDVLHEFHGMNHLLVGLGAHPVPHAVQTIAVKVGGHRQVNVVGLQLVSDLVVNSRIQPFADHNCTPFKCLFVQLGKFSSFKRDVCH